jgi:hypothetical protein
MSRPRVNGPRSLIITIAEAPVIGFVTFTRVPYGRAVLAHQREMAARQFSAKSGITH